MIALVVLLLCLTGGWWLLTRSGADFSSPQTLMQSVYEMGWHGILFYIGFLIVAIVVGPIPSTPMTIAAGAVWGPVWAGAYGIIGTFLGSVAAYFIGRTLGRSIVRALLGKVIYFSKHRGEAYLGWLAFVVHLIPGMPFDLVSYGAGISGLSLSIYAVAALLGAIPSTFFLTYMGASFHVGLPIALTLVMLFLATLIILPWGVKRYNWLALKDMIRIE